MRHKFRIHNVFFRRQLRAVEVHAVRAAGNTKCLKIARVLLGQHAVFIRLADNVFHTGRVHSKVFILVVAEAAHVRVETFKVNTRHVKAQGDRLIHAVVVAGLIRRTDELDEVSVTGAVNEALRFVCRKAVLVVDNHVCYCAIFEHGIHERGVIQNIAVTVCRHVF